MAVVLQCPASDLFLDKPDIIGKIIMRQPQILILFFFTFNPSVRKHLKLNRVNLFISILFCLGILYVPLEIPLLDLLIKTAEPVKCYCACRKGLQGIVVLLFLSLGLSGFRAKKHGFQFFYRLCIQGCVQGRRQIPFGRLHLPERPQNGRQGQRIPDVLS